MSTNFMRKCFLASTLKHRLKLLYIRQLSSLQLYASKSSSLIDDEVVISGSGFQPSQPITITGSVESEPDKINLQSVAHITTDGNGNFEMTKSESVGGTYDGVDGMGLFWSMKETVGKYTRFKPADAMAPYKFKFNVFNGHTANVNETSSLTELEIERRFYKPDIQRIPIEQDGIYGTLFLPSGKGPFPGIITLASFNRKNGAETQVPAFANHGYATFLVLYMGEGTLPKLFSGVEVEYFEKALNIFKNMDIVSDNGVGVYGRSHAGEIALTMATFLDGIKAAVSVNGSMAGVMGKTTYKDFSIQGIAADLSKAKLEGNILVNSLECIESIADKPEKQIPLEKADADILMFVGEDDKNWNSTEFANIAKERMRKNGKNNLKVISYPEAGHSIGCPYVPPRIYDNHGALPPGMAMDFGGQSLKKHVEAQIDCREKVLKFFKEKLR